MLRNALNSLRAVSRTPRSIPASAAASSPVHPPPRPLPYICAACQRRAIHGGRESRQAYEGLTDKQITEFEQHVAQMRKRAHDIYTRDQAAKAAPKSEDADRNEFFKALMAPKEETPKPLQIGDGSVVDVLGLPQRFKGTLYSAVLEGLTVRKPQWKSFIKRLEMHGGVKNWQTREVDKLLNAIPVFQRGFLVKELHDMIDAASIPKSVKTYCALMQGHLVVGDTLGARKLFADMRLANISPNAFSYGLLLKAYMKEKDMVNSAHVFTEMEALGIGPNKQHFTTFIASCLAQKEYDTAWEVFNTMKLRSVETGPDHHTYSTMIRAAAERHEAEKALDLYKDMTDRVGLKPNRTIYNALMYACAVRPDYYSNMWTLANEYVANKHTMDVRFLTVLMQGCAMSGDLRRARQLMRYMVSRSKELQPGASTFVMFFLCYAKYTAPTNLYRNNLTQSYKLDSQWPVPENEKISQAQIASLAMNGQIQTVKNDFRYFPLPLLQKEVLSFGDIIREANTVLDYLRRVRPQFVNTHLCNAYMEALFGQGHYKELRRFFEIEMRNFGDEMATVEVSPAGKKMETARVYKNMKSYDLAMRAAEKLKDLKFAEALWKEREEHLRQLVEQTTKEELRDEFKKFHWLPAKEYERFNRSAERTYIALLAKCNNLVESLNRIKGSMRRFDWKWNDLKVVYDKAIQLDDIPTAVYIRKICGKEHV